MGMSLVRRDSQTIMQLFERLLVSSKNKSISARLVLAMCLMWIIRVEFVKSDGTQCSQVFNFDAFYSVNQMQADNYYSYKLTKAQGIFTFPLNVTATQLPADYTASTLFYNFCSTVKFKSTETCAIDVNANSAFALTLAPTSDGVTSNCTTLKKLTTDSKFENYQFDQIDPERPQDGFVYSVFRSDETVHPDTQVISVFNTSITYAVYCDSANATNIVTPQGWRYFKNSTNEMYFIQIFSHQGCPTLELSKLWQVLFENEILITILMICIGALLCFFGLKVYNPTMFIIGYMTGFASVVVFMGEFVIRYDGASLMAWASVIIALCFGLLVGYVTVSNPKLGFFALGMWLGVILALLFNNAFLHKIQSDNQFLVLWVTIAVLATTMGLLSCFYYRYCVMVCTGFIGSYCLIRPFGWILGSFPNELQLAKQLKYGTITSVPPLFYLYFSLIILVGLIGIRFQYSMYASRRKNEADEDLQLYIAYPDFIELNLPLLDKDDQDLTEKEIETKKRLIRMQKTLEQEQGRQERQQKKVEKFKQKQQAKKAGDKHSSSSESNSDGEGSSSENEYKETENKKEVKQEQQNVSNDSKKKQGSSSYKPPPNIQTKAKNNNSKEKEMKKMNKQKKQESKISSDNSSESSPRNSSKSSGDEESAKKHIMKKNNKKAKEQSSTNAFSALFAGMTKSKVEKKEKGGVVQDSVGGIEMEDLSDSSLIGDSPATDALFGNPVESEISSNNTKKSKKQQQAGMKSSTVQQQSGKNKNRTKSIQAK